MARIRILQYPDMKLKRKGLPVNDFGPELQKIVDDMFETHYAANNCAALAATQLDIPNAPHITVIDFSPEKDQPLCLINAKIVERFGEYTAEEGCMSVGPGASVFAKVTRASKIKLKAQDRHGEPLEFEASDFMAKCIQHELDHLDGVLFIDLLSPLKRARILKQLDKQKRLIKRNED